MVKALMVLNEEDRVNGHQTVTVHVCVCVKLCNSLLNRAEHFSVDLSCLRRLDFFDDSRI